MEIAVPIDLEPGFAIQLPAGKPVLPLLVCPRIRREVGVQRLARTIRLVGESFLNRARGVGQRHHAEERILQRATASIRNAI